MILTLMMFTVNIFVLVCVVLFYTELKECAIGGRTQPNYEALEAQRYFPTLGDAYWNVYVTLTTSNFPDVMMAAYRESYWYAVLFVVYLLICLYLFMALVLASIYDQFKTRVTSDLEETLTERKRALTLCFRWLDWEQSGSVPMSRVRSVLETMLDAKISHHFDRGENMHAYPQLVT